MQSVWNQQKGYFEGIKDDQCPRKIFVDDLCKEVEGWLEAGDQLVIGMDANDDVRSSTLKSRLEKLGLVESITSWHGLNGPLTYNRGSALIIGLFVSWTLSGLKCRYDGFIWDHQLLWIEIPLMIAFGHKVPLIIKAKAQQLKCEDPRVVKHYLEVYRVEILQFDMIGLAKRLQERAGGIPLHNVKNQYDVLDEMRLLAILEADKRCRKLKVGQKQWTPDFQATREEVNLWNLVLRKKRGARVAGRYLERQIKICKQADALSLSLEEVMERQKRKRQARSCG